MSSKEEKSQKGKLSLRRKAKKGSSDLLNIIKNPSLNETCEFRSVEKMNKFFSGRENSNKSTNSTKRTTARKNLKIEAEDENISKELDCISENSESCLPHISKKAEDSEESTTLDEDVIIVENEKVTDSKVKAEEDIPSVSSQGKCPACGEECSSQDMVGHVQDCLKKRFERGSSAKTKELPVDGLTKTDNEAVGNQDEEQFFCQICQKDLTTMNSQRRTQHLNKCIDKEEETKQQQELEQKALQDARTATLPCPMCGRVCKTDNARKVHVKKCSIKLNVSTEQMLKLMKKQEDEHQMMIAAGILPKSATSKLKSNLSSTVLAKTKKTAKEPKSQYDADLQMALAISMSEAKPAEKPEPKKTRKKKIEKEPAMLVALTNEEKQRRLSQRVTTMLIPEEEDSDVELTPEFVSSVVSGKYTEENEAQVPMLWQRCSLVKTDEPITDRSTFYVNSLVPPIEVSKVKTGSKVRRMSEIPGRESSFMKPKTPVKPSANLKSRNTTLDHQPPDDSMMASTQTAVVLAELAADCTQATPEIMSQLNCSGFCPEPPISIQTKITGGLLEHLQTSLLSMVNNPTHSDVKIVTSDGEDIYCHKAIIGCRSQALIQEESEGQINLPNTTSGAVLSLMKYIYGGQVSVTESILQEVMLLAHRFQIHKLYDILKDIKPETEASSPAKSEAGPQNKTSVESLLKQLWSDSESETEGEGQTAEDDGIDDDVVCSDENVCSPAREKNFISENDLLIRSTKKKLFKNSPIKSALVISGNSRRSGVKDNESPIKAIGQVKESISVVKGNQKKSLNSSVVFENDELEVYSNISSSTEKSSPSLSNRSQNQNRDDDINLDMSCNDTGFDPHEDVSVCEVDHHHGNPSSQSCNSVIKTKEIVQTIDDISHKSQIDGNEMLEQDRELSPEIPMLSNSQGLHLSQQSKTMKQHEAKSQNYNERRLLSNSGDDLPVIESPRKSRKSNAENRQERRNGNENSPCKNKTDKQGIDADNESFECGKKNRNKMDLVTKAEASNELNAFHESFDHSNDSLIIIDENSNHDNIESEKNAGNKEKIEPATNESLNQNISLDLSGGDLFASPSPVIQRSRSQCLKVHENDDDDQQKLKPEDANCSHGFLSSFRKTKRKTSEMDTPTKSPLSSKRIKTCDSPAKNLNNDCDVSIVGDNFTEIASKLSPKFKVTEKKWKFSSKSDFVKTADITFSGSLALCTDKTTSNSLDYSPTFQNRNPAQTESKYENVVKDQKLQSNTIENHNPTNNFEEHQFEQDINNDSNADINFICMDEQNGGNMDKNTTVEYEMGVSMTTGDISESCDNVWDDFDDCGADGFGGIVDCQTPYQEGSFKQHVEHQTPSTKSIKKTKPPCNIDTPIHLGDIDQNASFENLTFCEEESFMIPEKEQKSARVTFNTKNSFKTPVMVNNSKQKKVWQEPSPFTPMPNFDDMATPQIKKKVQGYGVKPVGKKRMVKLLKDIYHQTHQYETDSEFEDEVTDKPSVDVDLQKPDSLSQDSDEDEDFNDSQESVKSDLMEETYFQAPDQEEDNQPVKPGETSLEEKLMNFINQQSDIQLQILMYEPLEIDVFKKRITEDGIKCSMEKLKEFLDNKCITFTMKNMRKSPRKRRRRSPKKSKPTGVSSPSKSQSSPSKSKKSPTKGRGRGKKKIEST